jgi:hypothetical protein
MNGDMRIGCAGFAYVAVMAMVVISGIVYSGAAQYWHTRMIREREAELLFRGDQYLKAIRSYAESTQGEGSRYPKRLEDLLKDPRYPTIRRHIRKLYPDPMAPDGAWRILRGAHEEIVGVVSSAAGTPIKQGGFEAVYAQFEGARSYGDWRFEYRPAPAQKTQQAATPPAGDETQ